MNLRSSDTDITLNGRVVNGRTHQREDGTYESLDLVQVVPGDKVVIVSRGGHRQTLLKGGDVEHSGALEGWVRVAPEETTAALGLTTLVLLEVDPSGTLFLTPRVVLRTGIEVGALDPLSAKPNVIRRLGTIASIEYESVSAKTDAVGVERLPADLISR